MIYDISLPLALRMPVWPGDPSFSLIRIASIDQGSEANVSQLSCSVHTGTHIDAPFHFIDQALAVEALDLNLLIGKVLVVEVPESINIIDEAALLNLDLKNHPGRVLFKTRNSNYWANQVDSFQKDFVAVSEDGADYLIQLGVKLVGIDYLSIAPFQDGIPTHKKLLSSQVVVIEGIDLSKINPGLYELICMPLKIVGSDGAPARVVLRDLD